MHQSAVTCLCVALEGSLEVTTRTMRLPPVQSALMCAGLAHAVQASGRIAVLYLDAADALAASLTEDMRAHAERLFTDHPEERAMAAQLAAGRMLEVFPTPVARWLDPRVEQVVSALRRGEALDGSVARVAAEVGLSPSRFMALFREGTGVPFRRYRRWARLLSVVRAQASGASLTRAAFDGAFASSAHLSAAFRAVFGVTPSTLAGIEVQFSEHPQPTEL